MTPRRPHPVAAILGLALAAIAHAQPGPAPSLAEQYESVDHGIAAVVEDRIITIADVRRETPPNLIRALAREATTQAEFDQAMRELNREVLRGLIDRVLIIRAFEEQEEFRIPQAVLESEFEERIIRQFDGDRGRFLEYLQERNQTVSEFRDELAEDIIVSVMRSQNAREVSEVSPERIEDFYYRNKIHFYQEDAIHLRQIILQPIAGEDLNILRQTARTILRELEGGATFASVARVYSQNREMRRRGGDYGWIGREDLLPQLSEVAFSLQPGTYSQPIEIEGVLFILYVEEKHEECVQPLDEVRDFIEDELARALERENEERWLERLRQNAFVRYYVNW